MTTMNSWPLKLKYRSRDRRILNRTGVDPSEGTFVYATEKHTYRSRTNPARAARHTVVSPRRSYGPWF